MDSHHKRQSIYNNAAHVAGPVAGTRVAPATRHVSGAPAARHVTASSRAAPAKVQRGASMAAVSAPSAINR
jgi:SMC interacting uncharacterized protein involved in chromosome segregation